MTGCPRCAAGGSPVHVSPAPQVMRIALMLRKQGAVLGIEPKTSHSIARSMPLDQTASEQTAQTTSDMDKRCVKGHAPVLVWANG